MMEERWFPLQHKLPDGAALGRLMHAGANWQIYRLKGNGRMLIARSALADRWVGARLIPDTVLNPFALGDETFKALAAGPEQRLEPIAEGGSAGHKGRRLGVRSEPERDAQGGRGDAAARRDLRRALLAAAADMDSLRECIGRRGARTMADRRGSPSRRHRCGASPRCWPGSMSRTCANSWKLRDWAHQDPPPPPEATSARDDPLSTMTESDEPAKRPPPKTAQQPPKPERRFRLAGRRGARSVLPRARHRHRRECRTLQGARDRISRIRGIARPAWVRKDIRARAAHRVSRLASLPRQLQQRRQPLYS